MSNKTIQNISIVCLAFFAISSTLGMLQGQTFISSQLAQYLSRWIGYAAVLVEGGLFCLLYKNNTNSVCAWLKESLWIGIPIVIYTAIRLLDTAPGYSEPVQLLNTLYLLCIACSSANTRQKVYVVFKWFMVISAIFGLVTYCAYFLGWKIPFSMGEYYQYAEYGSKYIKCFAGYLCLDCNTIRLCGWFNEPGYFGTMLALVLIAEQCNLQKWENIILLLAGLCSLSLAFFILLFLAVILNHIHRPSYTLALAVVAVFLIFVFIPNMATGNSPLEMFLNRSNIQDNQMVGNNRTSDMFNSTFLEFLHDPSSWLFGRGGGSADHLGNVLSLKKEIYVYGFLGCLLIYGSLVISSIRIAKVNWSALVFLACFLCSIYQRPHIFTAAYFILLFGGLEHIHCLEKQKHKHMHTTKTMILLPEPECGGAERITLTIARQLKAMGHTLIMVNCGSANGALMSWLKDDETFVSCGKKHTLCAIGKIFRLVEQERPQSIFVSHFNTAFIALLIGIFYRDTKVIVRFPTMPSNRLYTGINGLKERFLYRVNSLLLPSAHYVVAQTEAMRDEIISQYHLPPAQVLTLTNPLDYNVIDKAVEGAASPYPHSGPNFLAVGNISYAKAYDVLLDAFQLVREHIPSAELFIIGRTNNAIGTELLQANQDKSYIHFLDFQANPYPYMKYCDVFVLSSRMEGNPNVIREVMHFNRPVVATQCVPVVSELIEDAKNGYTVPINDPVALASEMQQAISLHSISNKDKSIDTDTLTHIFNY